MIKKLIRGRIIEILVVILLVFLSIPVWKAFEERYSMADVTTIDEYNLKFKVENKDNTDILSVNNNYYLFKNFKIYLKVKNNLDDSTSININGISYNINNFTKSKVKNAYLYTLVLDSMYGGQRDYNININFSQNKVNYSYILEEINKF